MVLKDFAEFKTMEGKTLPPSDWLSITQEMINRFADGTEDYQWIHVDVERAKKESPFKSTIAHGFLSIALVPKFLADVLVVSSLKVGYNYGLEKVRFPHPVVEGARLRAIIKVETIEEQKQNGLKIVWGITIEIENIKKPACVAKMITLVYE